MGNEELVGLLVGVSSDSLHIERLSDVVLAPASIYGIGEKRARKLEAVAELARRIVMEKTEKIAVIHGPEDAAQVLLPRVQFEQKEHFLLMTLNTKNHVIGVSEISVGSLTASIVHPREVFKEALARSAAAVIVAHNHPSGDIRPSNIDNRLTKTISEAGKLMNIQLIEHIIVGIGASGAPDYYSYRDSGNIL